MDGIGTIILLYFLFFVQIIAESNNDTFAFAGCNISVSWILRNVTIDPVKANILHPFPNKTDQVLDGQCNILDNSSANCIISERDDQWTLSLNIFNVSTGQSGKYTLQKYTGVIPKIISPINLIVIGKPKIKEVVKPILKQMFQITCDTHLGFEGFVYKWRINGKEITPPSKEKAQKIASLGVDDNFKHVACQVCLNETASNFSSMICERESCSIESDLYIIQAMYDTFAFAGCNISVHWILGNVTIDALKANILHPSPNKTAELLDGQCNILDNSSANCNISERDDQWTLSLNIFNVSTGQSGNYTLQRYTGVVPTIISHINLIVIGKPKIKEVVKPILNQTFQISCDTHLGFEGFVFKWRINGKEITPPSKENAHKIASLGVDDNFKLFTCQVCLNETASNFSSMICEPEACSIESDQYITQAMYGPDNVSLNLSESNFYLRDHDFFAIDCLANCSPNCSFRWKGQDTIDSKQLVITDFRSGMAGQYTCHVTNQETNITSKSIPIILHHLKVNKLKEDNMEIIGMGLVGVAVLLVVTGLVLTVVWCKNASNKRDSRILNQPMVAHQTHTNGEISQGISRIQNRPLPVHNTQETASREPYRLKYPNHRRKSRSLHNILDSTQDSFYPLSGGLSLQVLHSPSNIMNSNLWNGTQDYDSINERRFSNSLEHDTKLDFMYAKVKKDRKTNGDEHNTGAESERMNSFESFEQEPQQDLYSTIYEDAL